MASVDLPVTDSRTHRQLRTHGLTDNCKISIMMIQYYCCLSVSVRVYVCISVLSKPLEKGSGAELDGKVLVIRSE